MLRPVEIGGSQPEVVALRKVVIVIVALLAIGAVVVAVERERIFGREPTPEEKAGGEYVAELLAANERAKEDSRRLKQERARRRPVGPAAPDAGAGATDEAGKAIDEALARPFGQGDGHGHGHGARTEQDAAKHREARAVVKLAGELAPIAGAERPRAKADFGAVKALPWDRLGKLVVGYTLGQPKGGDFLPEVVAELNGAAVEVRGVVLPAEPPSARGELRRFWLATPKAVGEKCPYCEPPGYGDVVYVVAKGKPLVVDLEALYDVQATASVVGRFQLGPAKAVDGTEFLFGLEMKEAR